MTNFVNKFTIMIGLFFVVSCTANNTCVTYRYKGNVTDTIVSYCNIDGDRYKIKAIVPKHNFTSDGRAVDMNPRTEYGN